MRCGYYFAVNVFSLLHCRCLLFIFSIFNLYRQHADGLQCAIVYSKYIFYITRMFTIFMVKLLHLLHLIRPILPDDIEL